MLKLLHCSEDAYAFLERTGQSVSLTISCHGDETQHIYINGIPMNAKRLSNEIRLWMAAYLTHLHSIHLVVCYGANDPHLAKSFNPRRFSSAFGAKLSRNFKDVYVKSYIGKVVATCTPENIWISYREESADQKKDTDRVKKILASDLQQDFEVKSIGQGMITFKNGCVIEHIIMHRGKSYSRL